MRRLLVLVLVAATLWAGYWFIGARGAETALKSWLSDRQADGWVAHSTDVSVQGFPSRFDATFTDIELADPDTGLAWSAPFFQILALSYKPNHVIAVWPHDQTLATPQEKLTIHSDEMQASVVFRPKTDLELDRTAFSLDGFSIASDQGWSVSFPNARLATRALSQQTHSHEIGFEATQVHPSPDLVAKLGQTGLPEVFDALRLDAEVGFDAPWNRFAIEDRRPQPRQIKLRMLRAEWGKLELQAAGTLQVDDFGVPTGDISVRATNWREILAIAVATGAVPADLQSTLEQGLAVVAGLSGNSETLDVPLSFRRGRIQLGPVPIGPAPRLVIR